MNARKGTKHVMARWMMGCVRIFKVEVLDISILPTILPTGKTRYPDPEAHEAGCMSQDDDMVGSDLIAGYIDVYCSCHRYTEPKILSNGTDIAWPAGWNQEQAKEWRIAKGLTQPCDTAQPSPG